MSYLQKQMNFLRFDKRLLEINLKNGTLTQEEYNQYLNQLNDSAANAEKLEFTEESDMADSLNGGSHPAEPQSTQPVSTPPSSDPFGSGF